MRRLVACDWLLAATWASIWTAAGIGLWQADKHDVALCRSVRWTFGTQTTAGKIRFWSVYGTAATILGLHVVKKLPT